jgi:hypothetical protein
MANKVTHTTQIYAAPHKVWRMLEQLGKKEQVLDWKEGRGFTIQAAKSTEFSYLRRSYKLSSLSRGTQVSLTIEWEIKNGLNGLINPLTIVLSMKQNIADNLAFLKNHAENGLSIDPNGFNGNFNHEVQFEHLFVAG